MNEEEIIQNIKVICKCKAVKYKTIKDAILNGANTLELVQKKTGANTGCGRNCTDRILEMIEEFGSR
jgi:NAD(P)H-nitrite reductase large subunit